MQNWAFSHGDDYENMTNGISLSIKIGIAFELCICIGDDNADKCNLTIEIVQQQMMNVRNNCHLDNNMTNKDLQLLQPLQP